MNLLRAMATVSGFTLASRILGFVRDLLIAAVFGAGPATDAFFVAFRLPNLLRRLFAEGAFSQAFVPVLGHTREREGSQATQRLIDRVFTLLLAAVSAVTLVGIVGAGALIAVSAPGFLARPETFALAVSMTRITFPYILCMALVAFSSAILNTWGRFALPAATPVALNLSFITFTVLALAGVPVFEPPVTALAWAVLVGGLAQVLLHVPALRRLGTWPRWDWAPRDEGVRRVLRLMAPAVLGVSVAQVSLLINTVFASLLPSGSVSWLYYADRLMEFPSGLLGAALGTILLPSLSRAHARASREDYQALLDWGLRLTVLLTLPAAAGMALLAEPLVSTLFLHGAFDAQDALATCRALVAYSVGLTALIAVKILAPGFYAQQNVRTPVKIALVSLVATQAMNGLFVFVLPLAHAGLALSISLAAWLNAGLLLHGLWRRGTYRPLAGWGRFLLRVTAATLALGIVALWGARGLGDWLHLPALERSGRLALLLAACALAYFGTLYASGMRLAEFRRHGA